MFLFLLEFNLYAFEAAVFGSQSIFFPVPSIVNSKYIKLKCHKNIFE